MCEIMERLNEETRKETLSKCTLTRSIADRP